mmetsp:Transcript_65223/g.129054  ORF Transcript_65223/g.129054 Transcript_65223/m.129054 type:complete len:147 (-) Transcript_65223:53-493(-)
MLAECSALTFEGSADACATTQCRFFFKGGGSGDVHRGTGRWTTLVKAPVTPPPFVPGVMMQWEMLVGHSMTRWHWGSAEGTAEPAIPWDAHMFPDGTPVSYTEAAAVCHEPSTYSHHPRISPSPLLPALTLTSARTLALALADHQH